MKTKTICSGNYSLKSLKTWSKVAALSAAILVSFGCNKTQAPAPNVFETPIFASPTPVAKVNLTPGKIKPGVGVEAISLGEERKKVEQVLGKPQAEDANEFAPGQSYALYYSKGIELSYNNDKLEVITLHSANDSWTAYSGGTDKGLGVGSLTSDIVTALGEPTGPSTSRALRYSKLGLWFRLDSDRDANSDPRAESLQVIKPE